MADSLLTLFQTAYRNLDLLPLLNQKDLDRFRVEYGGGVIEELVQLVEDSGAADSKVIFWGIGVVENRCYEISLKAYTEFNAG